LTDTRVGEVTEAGTTEFTAQCYELYRFPPLGSLVKTVEGETALYGVVYSAATASIDPGRRPIARGRDEPSEEAIFQTSPQLSKLLRSEFRAVVVGFRDRAVHQYLPPAPPRVHSFVYQCPPEEAREFSRSFGFLGLLVGSHLAVPPEELVSACLRQMAGAAEDRHAYLVAAGKELAGLLIGDFARLKNILERLT